MESKWAEISSYTLTASQHQALLDSIECTREISNKCMWCVHTAVHSKHCQDTTPDTSITGSLLVAFFHVFLTVFLPGAMAACLLIFCFWFINGHTLFQVSNIYFYSEICYICLLDKKWKNIWISSEPLYKHDQSVYNSYNNIQPTQCAHFIDLLSSNMCTYLHVQEQHFGLTLKLCTYFWVILQRSRTQQHQCHV